MTEPAAADAIRSPLHDVHVALGAMLTPFAGWLMPLRYGSETAEHVAVRTAVGLFDLSHMGEIRVRGPQAAAALDHALVGNLTALAIGRARYSMIVAPDGGVIDDLVVYRLADTPDGTDYLVVANASNVAVVLAEIQQRAAGFDTAVIDESAETALIAVQGPHAVQVLAAVLDGDSAPLELKYYASVPSVVAGVPALVARTGYTGEDGFELFVAAGSAAEVWRAVTAAGEPFGLVPAGLSARDTLRLEAGMPLYGHELDRSTTPYDVGLGRVVKLDKATADGDPVDFVGREALVARSAADSERELIGLVLDGRRPARAGYDVVLADVPVDGEPVVVGTVTSGSPSPTLGQPIAMASVRPGLGDAALAIDIRGRVEPARRVALPFYRRG